MTATYHAKAVLREFLFLVHCSLLHCPIRKVCRWLEIGDYWGDLREPSDRDWRDVWRDGVGRIVETSADA